MKNKIQLAAQSLADQLITWRRHLHAHPELSGQEEQTARFVAAELRKMGYEPQERVGDTFGVTATLNVDDTPAIALRADMDALPVTEEGDVEYKSKNAGIMHACGHDAHMAMLLGAAKLLADRKDQLEQSVKLIFQPSEECFPGGAQPMIAAGVLNDVARIYGAHIWSEMPLGTIGTRVGPFMAASDDLRITVRGKGGHAAMPQQCVDSVLAAAHVLVALQSVVSRSITMTDSAVVSITEIHGGTTGNVIPEVVKMNGTVRTLSEATHPTVARRIDEIASSVAQAHGATAEVKIRRGYPVLVNDKDAVECVWAAARSIGFTPDRLMTLPGQGGGEDFAYYTQKVPGAFVFLGGGNESKTCHFPHHHPKFNIDEDALPLGAALLAKLALNGTAT